MKGVGDVIHGTSGDFPFIVLTMVPDSQRDLCKFGGHAQNSGKPHPEQRSGSSGQDCSRYTYDISAAHTACHCGTQCLVGRAFAGVWACIFAVPDFFYEIIDNIREKTELDKISHNGIKDAQTQQHHKHPVLPEKVCGGLEKVL